MFFTVEDAARELHCNVDTVRRLAANPYDRGMARFAVLALDQLRGLPEVTDQGECGVYFLWNGPRLIYVGMSQTVAVRVGQQKMEKPHTRATFERVSWRCVAQYEKKYIWHYGPPLNIMGRAWK